MGLSMASTDGESSRDMQNSGRAVTMAVLSCAVLPVILVFFDALLSPGTIS